MVVCKILTSAEDIELLASGWSDLHKRLGLSPFTDYDFALAWWVMIGKPAGAKLMVAVCYEGDRLVGVLPFSIRKTGPVRILRLLGNEIYYYRNFLVESAAYVEPLWELVLKQTTFDFADIKNIHKNTPEESFFGSQAKLMGESTVFHVPLSGQPQKELLARFSRSFRRKINTTSRAIAEDSRIVVGKSFGIAISEDLIDFLVSRKKAWTIEKGKKGVFDEADPRAIYEAMVQIGATKKNMLMHWMRCDGKPVGAILSFLHRGVLYAHTLAFDPSVGYLAPGIYLNTDSLIWASENGCEEMNFMEGEEPYKQRYTKEGRIICEYAFARTPLGWCFGSAYSILRWIRKMKSALRGQS